MSRRRKTAPFAFVVIRAGWSLCCGTEIQSDMSHEQLKQALASLPVDVLREAYLSKVSQ